MPQGASPRKAEGARKARVLERCGAWPLRGADGAWWRSVATAAATAAAAAAGRDLLILFLVVATATAPAATTAGVGQVVFGGNPAQFKGEAKKLADFLLQPLELAAGVKEGRGHGIGEQVVAGGFERPDFLGAEFHAGVLFLVELLAHLVDFAVLVAGIVVIQEALHPPLQVGKQRGLGDGGAEFPGLVQDRGIGGEDLHGRPP